MSNLIRFARCIGVGLSSKEEEEEEEEERRPKGVSEGSWERTTDRVEIG